MRTKRWGRKCRCRREKNVVVDRYDTVGGSRIRRTPERDNRRKYEEDERIGCKEQT